MDMTAIGVVVVTRRREFFETGLSVLNDVRGEVFQHVEIDADIDYAPAQSVANPVYREACDKAVRFLAARQERLAIKVIQADSLEAAFDKITAAPTQGGFQICMLFIDYADPLYDGISPQEIDEQLASFHARLQEAAVPTFCSSFSTAVFTSPHESRIRYQPMEYIECILPSERAVLQTELLCLWMDFLELSYVNRRAKTDTRGLRRNTLAGFLTGFLSGRAGSDWLGFYFTGSLVSNLINCFEVEANRLGALVLRGPSEHSLACGAMANWQLYKKPFAVIVTSGMIDEFRGTLANLREARAKGFIVCAENRASQWFAFQGTISHDEDTRAVLQARGIPYVYMEDVDNIAEDLRRAVALYDAGQGPVVLLATQAVLDAGDELDPALFAPAFNECTAAPDEAEQDVLQDVMQIINQGPERLLWQCGPMDEEELALTLSIAERAGIALTDSLTHPGSVPKYRDGKRIPNYLGTLAVYGYSPRVYNYLHTRDKLNPQSQQCLFFMKSKLGQVSTPFSEGRLKRKLRIVQLTRNAAHISPFTDHGLVMDYRSFLRHVDRHLDVSPALRERRCRLMASVLDTPSDVASKLPATPMSPNYFFARLNQLVEKLIVERAYDYTGLYDVGRCGMSAIRNVARTRRGFSGWYGRALMGDALQATLSVAYTSGTNVVAFIGDGAKGLVPEILPSFIENALNYPDRMRKNFTVFYFMNGGHSVINTYQERILFNRTSRQMRLVNLMSADWEEDICGLQVCARTLDSFDADMLAEALQKPGRINLFSVVVGHNNEGDGISLATATGWQRDEMQIEPAAVADDVPLIV
uniref:Uncharacterized protein n=1 Tax=Janthinobacterium lividum TaxID=29581 RepID=A0SYZ6_9BURK|nr:conserved hypothetical protein pigD [Janthinobacterium lividum]